jgi:methionyl-tRNA formyltransferase
VGAQDSLRANRPVRTILFGSPPFATPVFERLARSRHRPLALVSRPDKPRGRGREVEPSELVTAARALSIEVLQPADAHDPEHLARLRALEPDALVVASYGVILKNELLDLAPKGAFNVHASLLPRWRGASPIQAAIRAGDAVTGVTVQRIVPKLDEGDILLAREHAIDPRETSGTLLAALAELGGETLVEALDLLESGRAELVPQDGSRATYASKLRKEHGAVPWSLPASEIERHVRAMQPWPGARASTPQGREVTLLEARVVESSAGPGSPGPGTVLEAGERFVVACGANALEIVSLVPAGKSPMSGAEFLRGARITAGERLSAPAV